MVRVTFADNKIDTVEVPEGWTATLNDTKISFTVNHNVGKPVTDVIAWGRRFDSFENKIIVTRRNLGINANTELTYFEDQSNHTFNQRIATPAMAASENGQFAIVWFYF